MIYDLWQPQSSPPRLCHLLLTPRPGKPRHCHGAGQSDTEHGLGATLGNPLSPFHIPVPASQIFRAGGLRLSPPRTPTLSLPWWPGSGGVSPACPLVRVHPGHRSGTNIPGATPTPFATAARSPHVPQNTPGGRSSEETPRLARARGESDGNPIPRAAGQGGRGRTRARRCPLPQGLGGQDGVKVSGTGPGTGSRAPRSPAAAGKPRRAAGMLPPFLRASHVRDKHPLPALISSRGGRGARGARRGEKQKKTKNNKKNNKPKISGKKNSFPPTEEKDKVWAH